MDLLLLADLANQRYLAYAAFLAVIAFFLILDLGVFHREAHDVSIKEATTWSIIWLVLGISFAYVVKLAYDNHFLGLGYRTPVFNRDATSSADLIVHENVSGSIAARDYLTGYIVEKSLAMDNIFLISMLFSFFAIPSKYQHRVLFWGIIGALLMRGTMIWLGGELIMRYTWILIIFGLFLIFTAVKMALLHSEADPGNNAIVRLVKRFYPVTTFFVGQDFFTKRTVAPTYTTNPETGEQVMDPPSEGTLSTRWSITPLFLSLIMVEITDLIFAVDSIPAIFAITPDPFIVFTSNVFAMLGLRSIYFCLAALIASFRFLKPALILILGFVGIKLLLMSVPPYIDDIAPYFGFATKEMKSIKVDSGLSLGVIVATIVTSVVLSIAFPKNDVAHKGHVESSSV